MIYPNLAAEMARCGVSRSALASLVGLKENSFGSILRGETNISLARAKAIRDQFFPDMSLEYLFDSVETIQKGDSEDHPA